MATRIEEPFSLHKELYIPAIRQLLETSERSRFGLIAIGEAGQGKSSLVNGLLGRNLAKVGHRLKPETHGVNKYCYEAERGVPAVIVWDTEGFGIESDEREEQILQEMAMECDPVDFVLYCVRMDQTRWPKASDKTTIRKMTKVFGKEIWQHCLFVLTFANQIEGLCPPDQEVEQYFSERVWDFEEEISGLLKEHAGLSDKDIATIRTAIPVGDPRQTGPKSRWDLPTRQDWFMEFWFACAERIRKSSLPSLYHLNKDRFIPNGDVNSLEPVSDRPTGRTLDELSISAEVPKPNPKQDQPSPDQSPELHDRDISSLMKFLKWVWNIFFKDKDKETSIHC